MLRVRYDSKQLNSILNNAVKYSYGFLEGTDLGQLEFNIMLGEFTVDALNKYIDSHARQSPEALHHVYEWGAVGQAGARLFDIKSRASKRVIYFEGKFLPSKSVSQENSEPFVNKANIMENAIAIEVEPRAGGMLAFESNGETVFTTNSIYIENPGGDEVAGSFGRVVGDFFDNYFTNAILRPFIDKLSRPVEYEQGFAAGALGGGEAAGISAGMKYLRVGGISIE